MLSTLITFAFAIELLRSLSFHVHSRSRRMGSGVDGAQMGASPSKPIATGGIEQGVEESVRITSGSH